MKPFILANTYREAEQVATRMGFSWHAWRYLGGSYDLHGHAAGATVYQTPCWYESRSRDAFEEIRWILAFNRAHVVTVPCADRCAW